MSEPARSIVIVEDDEGMRRAIERLLAAAGYVTQSFASAEAVLMTQAAHDAACLVFDVRLPGLSGFELCARLGSERSRPPVVFMTAHHDQWGPDEARRAGAVALLVKPSSGQALLDAVRQAVAGQPKMEEVR